MERKMKYIAPAILEELKIEMEGSILYESKPVKDVDFQEVETMGQVVDEGTTLEHTWG